MPEIIGTKDSYQFTEQYNIKNNSNADIFDSIVIIRDKKTKKIVYVGKNRSMISAGEFFARKAFEPVTITPKDNTTEVTMKQGIDTTWNYLTKTYDEELDLDIRTDKPSNIAFNDLAYKVCLFCIGTSGVPQGSSTRTATYRDQWISLENIVPFRYASEGSLSNIELNSYYGKHKDTNNYVSYYFKKIDVNEESTSSNITIKKIYQNKANWSDSIYNENGPISNIDNTPHVIVTCNMSILENEGREYFISKNLKSKARFNCLSLCFATPYYNSSNELVDYYDIRPMTRINFTDKDLSDNSSYEISYSIYF